MGVFGGILERFLGSKKLRDLRLYMPLLRKINSLEPWAISLTNEELKAESYKLKELLKTGEKGLNDITAKAFSLSREAARRKLGERPYDVQIIAELALNEGKIIEMKTGEGKTLSSVAAAYLNSLDSKGVIIVTVNDYLAQRDANWMRPVFELLGVSVGVVLSNMDPFERKREYEKDITYVTNNELGFDYLRDNMRVEFESRALRDFNYCIIDEIDSILIDEARTPLIISGATESNTKAYQEVNQVVNLLKECSKDKNTGEYPLEIEDLDGDYTLDEKSKRISFTSEGLNNLEKLLQSRGFIKGSLFLEQNFDYVHYATQSLRAHKLFTRDVEYIVRDNVVEIVDEFTGRVLSGRRYSDGLHQALEAKEGVRVANENKTLATITFQNLFRMFKKISGMTGTADTEAKEFHNIYGLDVVVIPTNMQVARVDENDTIYFNEDFKFRSITEEVERAYKKGQPVLVGTASIEKSEKLSSLFKKRGIKHEVLNAKNHSREALIIAEAGVKYSVTIATNMAGRGTDIKLGGSLEHRIKNKVSKDLNSEDYLKLLSVERKKWGEDYEEVKNLGGLYVIGSERHESRRIDNQLRGRSGRQGDPGRSRFYVSLEDDLMRLFASDKIRQIMGRLGMASGEPITHSILTRSIENAQKRVEDRNFEIRKHLLEYDDVITKQREFIYAQRNSILEDSNMKERIYKSALSYLEILIEEHSKGDKIVNNLQILYSELLNNLSFTISNIGDVENKNRDIFKLEVLNNIEQNLNFKEKTLGSQLFNTFLKYEYLKCLDTKWHEHLANLDSLREAVYLRAYANKNPIVEYKQEGFSIFNKLIEDIKISILRKVLQIKIDDKPTFNMNKRNDNKIITMHSNLNNISEGVKAEPITRVNPKVGRNEPCPCGSGKKYKNCHGS